MRALPSAALSSFLTSISSCRTKSPRTARSISSHESAASRGQRRRGRSRSLTEQRRTRETEAPKPSDSKDSRTSTPSHTLASASLPRRAATRFASASDTSERIGMVITGRPMDALALMKISRRRGMPIVTFASPRPAKWNVLSVICVDGSPMDCDAMTPTASPGGARLRMYLASAIASIASRESAFLVALSAVLAPFFFFFFCLLVIASASSSPSGLLAT